ncbi:MAG: VanW family protein [Thermomicrobiales bacterium]
MNLTNRLGGVTAEARKSPLTLPQPAPRLAPVAMAAFLAVLTFVLAGSIGLALYGSTHAGRIYQGVTVGDLDLGGLTPQAAEAALTARFDAYAQAPITLTADDRTFRLTPADAGATLDSAATVDAAMAWGRQGNLWEQSQAMARGLLRGVQIAPVIALLPGERGGLAALEPEVMRPAVNASLTFDDEGNAAIVPDEAGIQLNYAATTEELADRISRFSTDPVTLFTEAALPSVTSATLSPALPSVLAAVDAPLVIAGDGKTWHVPAANLQPLLDVDPATQALSVDERPLRAMVIELAAQIDRDASDAGITVDDHGKLAVVPAVDSATVNVDASTVALATAILTGEDDAELVITQSHPQISDAMAAAAVEHGEDLLTPGITLSWNGGKGELDRSDLLEALTIHTRPGQDEPFVFGLDPELVREDLGEYAESFDIVARDARWRISDGTIQLAVPDVTGRGLDLDSGVETVTKAFLTGTPQATLKVETIVPTWTRADGASITLGNDILADASTYYGDSSDARRQNVELASGKISGWLVPPGGVFSYADSIGLITEDEGFVTGYGIIDDGAGGFTTAPVVGGGICQVSTTLFQAAFWAGLPIVERYQHPYYLRTYGEAPAGLPGLDAMVNIEPDWRLDLKFENSTDHWLAVVMIPDGTNVYARLIGTNPGWRVEVPQPELENIVHPDEAMRYTESPEFPVGEERLVESARDGFDVRIDRTVYAGDKVILEDSFFSSFAPSYNTTMRGTGAG